MSEQPVKLYVITSHVDKKDTKNHGYSKFETPIQAGAALTDKRICEINDHDDFSESISERNARYCEGTAVYWVSKHLDADFIGIEHYRRRFAISDRELEELPNLGIDIVTTSPIVLLMDMKETYCTLHYGGDWDMLMDVLKDHDPDNFDFYSDEVHSKELHYGNINIMRADIFREYCDWIFPILDDCYYRSPAKFDRYNHRDIGFMMERLSHLCNEKKETGG